jgi:hypothetical protein
VSELFVNGSQLVVAGSSLVAGRGGPSWGQGGAARASRDDDLDAGEGCRRLKQRRGSLGHRCGITAHPVWAEVDGRSVARGRPALSRCSDQVRRHDG